MCRRFERARWRRLTCRPSVGQRRIRDWRLGDVPKLPRRLVSGGKHNSSLDDFFTGAIENVSRGGRGWRLPTGGFRPRTGRSALRQVSSIDGTGTAKSGGKENGSYHRQSWGSWFSLEFIYPPPLPTVGQWQNGSRSNPPVDQQYQQAQDDGLQPRTSRRRMRPQGQSGLHPGKPMSDRLRNERPREQAFHSSRSDQRCRRRLELDQMPRSLHRFTPNW